VPSEPAATDRKGLEFESFFNSGDRHIADITWVSHDVGIPGSGFEMYGAMAPDFWDRDSVTIVASKYFYGKTEAISPTTGFRALPDEGGREYSVGHPIGRIANTIANAGLNRGYYDADNCAIFRDELKAIMLHQIAAFNSPVW
jgi:ribonucleoside-diphosphate reductase alpha chain